MASARRQALHRGGACAQHQVITELVINHTSDKHPWFQRARRAKPGTAARDFYVWSDTDKAYAGTRIIFLDTEKSNWTWDEEAQSLLLAPLLFASARSQFRQSARARSDARRPAISGSISASTACGSTPCPISIEREGTNSENLPETHAFLKHVRAEVDANYKGRMLLAEANQWPEDAQAYFGNGDECHMVFHFPLMPRMFMAIAQEDRFPITESCAKRRIFPRTASGPCFCATMTS